MRSLRWRLVGSLAVVTAATFAIAAVATYHLFRRSLLAEFDELLAAKARTLAMLAEPEETGVEFEFHEHELVDFSRAFDPEYFESWDDAGRPLVDSGHSPKLPRMEPGTLDAPHCEFVTLPDGRPGRMIAVRFLPVAEEAAPDRWGSQWITLAVARDSAPMDRALSQLAWMLGGVSMVAVTALVGLLAWVVVRSLRPLGDFARSIEAIGEADLATRVVLDRAPTEMAPMIDGFNNLLERIEAAFERERRFSSNVAHELRTPLSGLLATIQVALSRQRDGAEYRAALARCEDISQETHRLVETLLSLARWEAGKATAGLCPVELNAVITDEWARVADRAEAKALGVSFVDDGEVFAAGDVNPLRIVVANLLDNAVEYTPVGGTIRVECTAAAGRPALTMINGPCELSAQEVGHVFDEFWRGDAARTNTGVHAGLGLALVQRIVRSLGGEASATLEFGCFVMRITLSPAMASASAAPPAVLVNQ
jgi:signal transduction histidine kinase